MFEITSKNFKNNDTLPINQVYNGYGAGGNNLSPHLSWQDAPKETESFAIVCHDPDAPKQNGWYHWFLINIPSNVTSIDEGSTIKGTKELITDFQEAGYNGAAPPKGHGKHRYNFTVYALNTSNLNITETVPYDIEQSIVKHAIAKATITALYER